MQPRTDKIGELMATQYGEGDVHTVCIGGMSYAPTDFARLAEQLTGPVAVLDNPFQTGRLPWESDFVDQLRQRYVEALNILKPQRVIAHSCGSFDALHLADSMPSVRQMVLMTPPNGTREWIPQSTRLPEFGLLDLCLADLCKDMPDDLYEAMLKSHQKTYAPTPRAMKELYKKEMPARRKESIEGVLTMLRSSRRDILLLFGRQDPWKIVEPGTVDYGQRTTVRQIDTGHFPHVSRPHEVAALVEEWSTGYLERAIFPSTMTTGEKPLLPSTVRA